MKPNFSPEQFFDLTNCSFRELFEDVEKVWELLPKLVSYLEEQFSNGSLKGNYKENIFLGEGTIVEEGSLIKGPAIIGKNCTIGHAAFLRNGCLFGDNINIGHAVEIKGSILLSGVAVAHLNYLGDSILGNNVNLSGGAIAANFRLDKKPIAVRWGRERIETNLQKFGSVIGDGSNIGVHAVLNPGTILGKNTIVYPLREVRGMHEDNEVIK